METHIQAEPVGKAKGTSIQKITPFLWFDNESEEAVDFYTSLFHNSKIKTVTRYSKTAAQATGNKEGSVMTISFRLEGQDFTAINGGPVFQINPSISFFINCETTEEVDWLWSKLSVDGEVLMELKKYPFSEKYGWVRDRFGVSWQLIVQEATQKITPCLLFTGDQFKRAEEAIHFYISVFSDPKFAFDQSEIVQLSYYPAGMKDEGAVMHAKFTLNGQEIVVMDSSLDHNFNFNPAVSLVVSCRNQTELDYYWDKLSEGGFEGAQQCGWLEDKFGVSWQIVPDNLDVLLGSNDPERTGRVMQAVLQMKKLDIKTMQQAYDQK